MTHLRHAQKSSAGARRGARSLRSDRQAGVAVTIAVLFPTMIAMGLLAVDAVRAYSQDSLVRNATQLAALAGQQKLINYYNLGATAGTALVVSKSAEIGRGNVASAADTSNVIQSTTLGTWNAGNATFTSLADSGSKSPNAVQVIGHASVDTYFAGAFGIPTLPISKDATATFGPPAPINVIVLNDMGGPNPNQSLGIPGSAQANWWAQQQAADVAIMRCVQNSGNTSSHFGVTGFVEQGYTLQALTTVSSSGDATAVSNNINNVGSFNFQYCRQSKAAHLCHGSNVAAAIYSATAQLSGANYAAGNNHIVILTNELPIYDPTATAGAPLVYTAAMGTGVTVGSGKGADGVTPAGTGSSGTALCGTSPICSSTNLKQMAEGQAAAAGTAVSGGRKAITVSTVYFSGDASTPAGSAAAFANEIASWNQNGGVSVTTSVLTDTSSGGVTTPGVATQAKNVCQFLGATLKLASF